MKGAIACRLRAVVFFKSNFVLVCAPLATWGRTPLWPMRGDRFPIKFRSRLRAVARTLVARSSRLRAVIILT